MGSIYKITNKVNGKVYIGQTVRDAEKTRIPNHLNGNTCGNKLIKKDLEIYGKKVFDFEILHDGIIPEFLRTLESEEIKKYNCVDPHGYNENYGGGGVVSHSEETRKKMSASKKGKPLSDEHKDSLSKSQRKRKPPSPETLRKMSESQKGKKHSPETRKKLSISRRKRPPASEETKRKMSENNARYWKGKNHSEVTKEKLAKINRLPEYDFAYKVFLSLPPSMPIKEKRKTLYKNFETIKKATLRDWVRKWTQP